MRFLLGWKKSGFLFLEDCKNTEKGRKLCYP